MKLFRMPLAAVAAAIVVMHGVASAAPVYPQFDVNTTALAPAVTTGPPTNITIPSLSSLTANKIVGDYAEAVRLNADGSFDVAIRWIAGQFVDVQNPATGTTAYSSLESGLTVTYGLFAYFYGSGTRSFNAAGDTIFNLTPGGQIDFFGTTDTTNVQHAFNWGTFTWSNDADNQSLLGTGSAVTGEGLLKTGPASNSQCGTGGGIDCGSFGQTSTFGLTALGKALFTKPNPFYELTFASGQFNDIDLTAAEQFTNGSLDVTFGRIPEPATLALVGLALVGAGAVSRRRKTTA